MHAAALARELRMPLLLIPRESSVFCAAGMLIADLKHDYVRTTAQDLAVLKLDEIQTIVAQMVEAAHTTLATEGVDAKAVHLALADFLRRT